MNASDSGSQFAVPPRTPQTPSPVRKRPAPSPSPSPITPSRDAHDRKWARDCGCSGPCQAALFDSDDSDCDNLDEDELKRLMQRRPREDSSISYSSSIDDLDGKHRVAATTSTSDIVITSGFDSGSEQTDSQPSQPPMLLHYIMGF